MEQKKISEGNAALKPPVEVRYQKELEALAALDTAPRGRDYNQKKIFGK